MSRIPVDLNTLTRDVVCDVLETMFFSTAVISGPCACPHQLARGASLEFHGAFAGTFFAMLTPGVARALAGACLGLSDEEITSETESQLACELANVLCGGVLSRLDPEASVYLSAPQPINGCPRHIGWCEWLETPEGPLCVGLSLLGEH